MPLEVDRKRSRFIRREELRSVQRSDRLEFPEFRLRDPHRDIGAAIFRLHREDAEAEPLRRCALEGRIAGQDQPLGAFLRRDRGQAHPNLGHRSEVAADIKIDVEAWVDRA